MTKLRTFIATALLFSLTLIAIGTVIAEAAPTLRAP
jgi:hypothetical protein